MRHSLRRLVLGTLALFLALLSAAPAQAEGKRRKVAALDVRAVGDFEPKTIAGLSTLIAFESAQFPVEVISGADVRALISYDREKQLLGCSDSSCLAEIGGALGVDLILSSEVSEVGGVWLVSLTMLDVAKAEAGKRVIKRTNRQSSLVDLTSEATREIFRLAGLADGAAKVDPKQEKLEAREAKRRARMKKEEAPAEAVAPAAQTGDEPPLYRRRSKFLMFSGIGLVVVGVGSLLLGAAANSADPSAMTDQEARDVKDGAKIMMGGGLVIGAVGGTFWIIGRKYVPVERPAHASLLTPGEGTPVTLGLSATGLTLRF